jgi:hypothetical protein
LEYPYLSLRTQWDNLRVCPECFDPKHPQIKIRAVSDRTAVHQPRPGENAREDATVRIWRGVEFYARTDGPISYFWTDGIPVTTDAVTVSAGTVVGSATVFPSGTAVTASVGNEAPQSANIASGEAATFATGTVSIDIDLNTWGKDSWGENTWGD